jgi:TRAP-type C4-dicarboxylate transport system permease small subunit
MNRESRIVTTVAKLFESVAAGFLVVMVLLTVADVGLRSISNAFRIFGVIEIVVLAFAWSVFLALPAIFVNRQNIVVNVLDPFLGRAMGATIAFAALVTVAFLSLLGSQTFETAREALRFNDQTMYLAIPIFAYILPIIIGVGGALLAEIYRLFRPTAGLTGWGNAGSDL